MMFRAVAALAVCSLLLLPAHAADAAGTVVITKLGGKPQTIGGARLVIKSQHLIVTLPDKRSLEFVQSSCENSTEVMECQPVGVTLRNASGAHDLDFSGGLGYFNLTKVPQAIGTTPPEKLPPNGLSITLTADNGTTVTIRGTLDVGNLAGH